MNKQVPLPFPIHHLMTSEHVFAHQNLTDPGYSNLGHNRQNYKASQTYYGNEPLIKV